MVVVRAEDGWWLLEHSNPFKTHSGPFRKHSDSIRKHSNSITKHSNPIRTIGNDVQRLIHAGKATRSLSNTTAHSLSLFISISSPSALCFPHKLPIMRKLTLGSLLATLAFTTSFALTAVAASSIHDSSTGPMMVMGGQDKQQQQQQVLSAPESPMDRPQSSCLSSKTACRDDGRTASQDGHVESNVWRIQLDGFTISNGVHMLHGRDAIEYYLAMLEVSLDVF